MKKIFYSIIGILLSTTVFAQAPQSFKYQAVARNASGEIIADQKVGFQISILQSSETGTSVYSETHVDSTNQFGLVTLEIGTGTTTDDFTAIDWGNDTYFIQVEMDATGGTSYTLMGTSQLLSVPYALHAETAENVTEADPVYGSSLAASITGTDTASWNAKLNNYTETDPVFDTSVAGSITATDTTNWNNKQDQLTAGTGIEITNNVISTTAHHIGESYGDGIVFYVYDNGQHGLIASLDDLDGGSGVAWSDVTATEIGAAAKSFYDGASNTNAIIAQQTATSAAQLCRNLGADWYLPSSWELNLLYNEAFLINKILENDGNGSTNGFNAEGGSPTKGRYWSSTEDDSTFAWYYSFSDGNSSDSSMQGKATLHRVRAVRAF